MPTKTDHKRKFLLREFALLSMHAALATRNKHRPVYAGSAGFGERSSAKKAIYQALSETASVYTTTAVSEADHLLYIEQVSDQLSSHLTSTLLGSRFRIGICQKLINLYLKYLWSAGYCQEPPHCPIDGIIRDRAKIDYDWTGNDSLADYRKAIGELRRVAGKQSLAQWELAEFARRQSEP